MREKVCVLSERTHVALVNRKPVLNTNQRQAECLAGRSTHLASGRCLPVPLPSPLSPSLRAESIQPPAGAHTRGDIKDGLTQGQVQLGQLKPPEFLSQPPRTGVRRSGRALGPLPGRDGRIISGSTAHKGGPEGGSVQRLRRREFKQEQVLCF